MADVHSEEAEFAAVRAAVGAEAAIVREKLDKAENDLAETRSDLIKERKNLFDLLDQIGQIRAEAASAREKADAAQKHLEASATGLQRMMALPGVADAALPPAFEPISLTDFTVKSVRGAAGAVSAASGASQPQTRTPSSKHSRHWKERLSHVRRPRRDQKRRPPYRGI